MASPRQLAYRDTFVWELEQVVSAIFDDCDGLADPYIFPDMTTRIPFVMLLSQEQFTTLYTAVLTGADLSYPNTSHDVENLFLQMVNCPMNEFCVALINCLENDPDTLAALLALLAGAGVTGGVGDPEAPLGDDILGGNLLSPGYVCTDDAAFGMALAVVNALNDATTEVLQAIELVTNPVEIASEIADNIPGAGMLATASDMAAWIQNTAQEQYELAWSATVRDELACDLWCAFKADCILNFDVIWDVYFTAAGVTPPAGNTLEEWIVWLMALTFPDAKSTVARISLLGLLAMKYGGSFGGFQLGIRSLETVIRLSEDDSSPDWSTLCDACPTFWCFNWLNGETVDMVTLEVNGCSAQITTTQIIGCTEVINTGQYLDVTIAFPVSADVNRVRWTTSLNPTRGTGSDTRMFINGIQEYHSGSPTIGEVNHDVPGAWTGVNFVRITGNAASSLTGTSPDGDGAYSYLLTVTIDGPGANPEGADNC